MHTDIFTRRKNASFEQLLGEYEADELLDALRYALIDKKEIAGGMSLLDGDGVHSWADELEDYMYNRFGCYITGRWESKND